MRIIELLLHLEEIDNELRKTRTELVRIQSKVPYQPSRNKHQQDRASALETLRKIQFEVSSLSSEAAKLESIQSARNGARVHKAVKSFVDLKMLLAEDEE